MVLRPSGDNEINILTKMSILAFHTDYLVGGDENDGPPDYDSVLWHKQMKDEGRLYSYLDRDVLIGGAVLFLSKDSSSLYIGRIFISPEYHKKGYGFSLMNDIEKAFPTVMEFKLDTPLCNIRTNNLYKKCGYTETDRSEDTITYIKKK